MDLWISFGEGFLLVFSIIDKESFDIIKCKYERVIKGKHGIKCPIILVGNKKDLENERRVLYSEAKNQADLWGIEYIETSAKTDYNIKEAFEKVAKGIIQMKFESNKKKRNRCIII